MVLRILLLLVSLSQAQIVFNNMCRIYWDKNVETDLAGYKLYEAKLDNFDKVIDVGKDTSIVYTVTDIDSFLEQRSFRVTAYDLSGNESEFSQSVNVIVAKERYLFGDYNGDKVVNSLDLTQYWIAVSYGYNRKFDYNLDGRLDNTDHLYLIINHGQKLE